MKSVVVRCPECNAVLEAGAETREVRCSYCGTLAQVQRRTGIFQRPEPLPPPQPEASALPVATQPRSAALMILGSLLGVIPMGLAIGLPVVLCGTMSSSPPYGPFVVADANGDGTEDIVAMLHSRESEANRLAAFDGRTGKKLWRSEELSRGNELMGVLCAAGGVVLYGTGGPELRALGLADGKQRYLLRLDEGVKGLCEGPDPGRAVVVLADQRTQLLTLADGGLAAGGAASTCRALACDPHAVALKAHQRIVTSRDREVVATHVGSRAVPGMAADQVIGVTGSDITLALGKKSPGTPVPMLASIRQTKMGTPRAGELSGDGTAVLWQTAVPAGDALAAGAASLEPDKVAVDGKQIVVPFQAGDRQHLALFDLTDGKRRWQVTLPEDARNVWSVALTPQLVIASSTWGLIVAHELSSGREVYDID